MKKYKPVLLFLIGIIILIFSMGFQKEKSREDKIQELIDAKAAEKVKGYREKYLEKCRDRILERANELADVEVMDSTKTLNIIDNTSRPIPPPRPLRPDVKTPIDTTPVIPFFSIDSTQ